jgi:ferritin-like protein
MGSGAFLPWIEE